MDHTPTYTQVPPADSIGRHLCEVACSCGLFRTTSTSGHDGESARAAAESAFASHRDRAGHAAPPVERRGHESEPVGATRPRRRAAYVAAAAVVVVVGAAVAAVLLGQDDERDYEGAPALVGGPDRTGAAVLDPGDADPFTDDDPLTREDGYAELRAAAPEFVSWTTLEIDRASDRVCRLLDSGRSVAALDPALVAFASAFDC